MAGKKNGKKKQKRPLAEGVVRPPKRVRRRPEPKLSPRAVRRTAWLVGLLTPVLMIGLAALGTNPDYAVLGGVLAFLVFVAGFLGLGLVRPSGWVIWPAVLFGVLLLVLPVSSLRAQIIAHRGVETEVVVTAAHSSRDKSGRVSWTCDIRRADGQPLPHGQVGGFGCSARAKDTTETVLVDPAGWAPPAPTDEDLSFRGSGVYVVAVLAALWGLLTLGAARRTLQEPNATAGQKADREGRVGARAGGRGGGRGAV
ncbi:hypothetical protein BX285_4543 [Streptomyces sp. 1114.5]|uniref:hypothetical protein n=1 Tax=Streptomyces sp. 1114.5 TaxID=1938830 RepID=UPI000EB13637|nr:hypothetical protein [Streptomyces sp. 1114.5]RKT20063.1 hypothetical protein BX285_4543 [Streptomyces sp. 1114.5]